MATNPPVPPGPGAPPPAPVKKTSPLVWVLVGIGAFFMLIIVGILGLGLFVAHKAKQAGLDTDLIRRNPAMAAAKLAVAANPNTELVSVDERSGMMTVKDKQTGKTYTMSFEDAKSGKFTFKEDGKAQTLTIGGKAKFPAWVPDYPGSDPQGAIATQGTEGDSGTFTFKTSDPSDKVVQYYQDQFKSGGLKVTSNVTSQDGKSSAGMLQAQDEANKHVITVIIGSESNETAVSVTYATNK